MSQVRVMVVLAVTSAAWGQELQLVSARDHILGCFTTPKNVWADEERIYLTSRGGETVNEGKLFVLKKSLLGDFPLVQEIDLTVPSQAVRGTADKLYVACDNGSVQVFNKTWPLTHIQSIQVVTWMLGDLEVASDGAVYVSIGEGSIAVDEEKLYFSCFSDRQVKDLMGGQIFQGIAQTVQVFSRQTEAVLGSIPFPPLDPPQSFNVSVGENHLYLARGRVWVYDKMTLAPDPVQIIETGSANTTREVIRDGQKLLVVGEESGIVSLWDCTGTAFELLPSLNISALTGFTQSEAIEIKCLWVDEASGLIFAGSSWGNDSLRATYGGTLPSAFVARMGCPPLWADADFDRDVDQSDFGFFQTCLGPLPAWGPCACLDVVKNGAIDTADLLAFQACSTGPSVPVLACPP